MDKKRDRLQVDDHVRIDGEAISGKIIEIGRGKMMDMIYGGAVLDDCEIRILGGGSSVNLFGVTVRNSIFKTRSLLSNVQFLDVRFEGCTFLGKYRGCRFGRLESENCGAMRDCDFTNARLDFCDFYDGTDVCSLQFPPWPHICVLRPYDWSDEWLSIPFPADFRSTQEIVVDPEMTPCEAIVAYLPADCPGFEEMRGLLDKYDRIIINY